MGGMNKEGRLCVAELASKASGLELLAPTARQEDRSAQLSLLTLIDTLTGLRERTRPSGGHETREHMMSQSPPSMQTTTSLRETSVITVTYNNAAGLAATLGSLSSLKRKPFEVIVIDGLSSDDTRGVVDRYRAALPIKFVSEPDQGIYDAMNKGQRLARGDLLHYLNAGDTVWGDPYADASEPCLLPTRICEVDGRPVFEDFVKLFGYGYCHQGMLLPRNHEPYNTTLRIVADLEMVIGTFPDGLRSLPRTTGGGVKFFLGGVSSEHRNARDQEIRSVFHRRLPFVRYSTLSVALLLKAMMPGALRKSIARGLALLRTR